MMSMMMMSMRAASFGSRHTEEVSQNYEERWVEEGVASHPPEASMGGDWSTDNRGGDGWTGGDGGEQ